MQRAYLWSEQQLRAAAWCQGITMVRGPGREIACSWELPKLSSLLSIICGGKAKVRENLQKQSCGLSDTGPAQAPEGRGISSKKKNTSKENLSLNQEFPASGLFNRLPKIMAVQSGYATLSLPLVTQPGSSQRGVRAAESCLCAAAV